MSDEGQRKPSPYGRVIAKAWREPAFKAKLIANPRATLAETGVSIPADVTVKVVEDTPTRLHLVLPPKPTGELSDEALDKIAAGDSMCVGTGQFTRPGWSAKP